MSLCTKLTRFIARHTARYMICDTHNTEQYAYTWGGALGWLSAAGDDAWIVDLYRMEVASIRRHSRVY